MLQLGSTGVLPAINESMPEGTSIEVGFDSTLFIDRSIKNVFTTILEATGLVIIIIFLFLHSIRAAIIPVVTIPVSLHHRLCHHVCGGAHDQYADAAGLRAGHRAGGG